jgi:hypothetical protein
VEHQTISQTLWAFFTIILSLVCILGGSDLSGAITNVVTFGACLKRRATWQKLTRLHRCRTHGRCVCVPLCGVVRAHSQTNVGRPRRQIATQDSAHGRKQYGTGSAGSRQLTGRKTKSVCRRRRRRHDIQGVEGVPSTPLPGTSGSHGASDGHKSVAQCAAKVVYSAQIGIERLRKVAMRPVVWSYHRPVSIADDAPTGAQPCEYPGVARCPWEEGEGTPI